MWVARVRIGCYLNWDGGRRKLGRRRRLMMLRSSKRSCQCCMAGVRDMWVGRGVDLGAVRIGWCMRGDSGRRALGLMIPMGSKRDCWWCRLGIGGRLRLRWGGADWRGEPLGNEVLGSGQ